MSLQPPSLKHETSAADVRGLLASIFPVAALGQVCARRGSDDWCPHSVRDTSRNACANALRQRKNLGRPFSEAAASQAVTGGPEGLTRLRWWAPWPSGKGGNV